MRELRRALAKGVRQVYLRFRIEVRRRSDELQPYIDTGKQHAFKWWGSIQKFGRILAGVLWSVGGWLWRQLKSVLKSIRAFPGMSALVLTVAITFWFVVRFAFHLAVRIVIAFAAATDIMKSSALAVALAALVVAWNNFRRGNTAIIKIVRLETKGVAGIDENSGQPYSVLSVIIKNIGIPLKSPIVVLSGFTRAGRVGIPLRQFQGDKPVEGAGTLEKGMFAVFALRSFELHQGERMMIAAIADPEVDDVALEVGSNGFAVTSFRLRSHAPIRVIKKHWNNWAHQINSRFFWKTRTKWGQSILYTPSIIPEWNDRLLPLAWFAQGVAGEKPPSSPPNPPFPFQPR